MPSYPAYYRDAFDPTKNRVRQLGVEDQYFFAQDLNEAISAERFARRGVADTLFRDGAILRGASILVDPATGATTLDAGAIYVQGMARELDAADITIPVDGEVYVGVILETRVITSVEDATLTFQNFPTLAFESHGFPRQPWLEEKPRWGSSAEALTDTPTVAYSFFPVYKVVDGSVIDTRPPTETTAIVELIERYDRESNGHYIAKGCELLYLSTDEGAQVYSLAEGTVNVDGRKIDRPSSQRLTYGEDPDLERIDAEPHLFEDGGSHSVVITLNRTPIDTVHDVSVLTEKTVTITRGLSTGGRDPLPDAQIQSIVEVKQGATTYVPVTSYNRLGDEVDWSPGGPEPATGSTYTVKYQYKKSVAPAAVTTTTVTVTDATIVTGSEVDVDYSWKMPRYDVICIDRTSQVQRLKGVASPYNPQRPTIPAQYLEIAQVEQRWTEDFPVVRQTGIKAVPNGDINAMRDAIVETKQELARIRLQTDASARTPAATNGIFADNFDNDAQRDAGIEQTASIVGGELTLSIDATPVDIGASGTTWSLNYTLADGITQPLMTRAHPINPYLAIAAWPATITLSPSIDEWTELQTQWASAITRSVSGRGSATTSDELLSSTSAVAEFLRVRDVAFRAEGFNAGEVLAIVLFDGIDVTPDPAPAASSDGVLAGTFAIPEGIPAGTKTVEVAGADGSMGTAVYTGRGTITIEERRRVTTTFTGGSGSGSTGGGAFLLNGIFYSSSLVYTAVTGLQLSEGIAAAQAAAAAAVDPVFQSFTPAEGFHLGAVAFRFGAIGDRDLPVVVQLRDAIQGLPGSTVLAEARIAMTSVTTVGDVEAAFESLPWCEAGIEKTIVWLTDDPNHAIMVAEIGKYDQVNGRWVTQQPYGIGVFGSSSNARAWTVHQELDAYFRLRRAVFSEATRTVSLGTVAATAVTDILALAGVEIPAATTGVELIFQRPNGDEIRVAPGAVVSLDQALTETLIVKALLKGVPGASPILFADPQVVLGALALTGDYVSRAFTAGSGVTMRVELDVYAPGASTVVPKIQADDDSWEDMDLVSTEDSGDGWHKLTFELEEFTAEETRVKVLLTGTALSRPRARSLVVMPLDI